jgi:hypothetical protein
MKRVLFLGVILALLPALLLIGTDSVLAQAAQTPLGTFAFSTSTPVPSTATHTPLPPCASGISNISGLDPNWLASCGHCVSTATPTSQYVIGTTIPTGDTSTPGTTATPAQTATSTPSPWQLHYASSPGGEYPAASSQFTMETDPEVAGRIVGMAVAYLDQPSAQQARNLTSETGYSGFSTWSGGSLAGRTVVIWAPAQAYMAPNAAADRAAFVGERDWFSWTGGFGEFWIVGQEAGYIGMWIAQIGPGFASHFQPIGYVYFGEPLSGEATPTPSVVSCTQPTYRDETPIVSYGGFQQLGGSCYTLIPGFSFTIPSIFGLNEEFNLGADTYQLCVQWYSFPELSILTLQIPLDLVILPAAVWLFRRFMEL